MENDLPQLFRIIAALAFVLALMGGLTLFLRKMGYAQTGNTKRRLKLIEVLHLDSKNKLAIIQRDDKQHVILMGATGSTLIESNIESVQDIPHVT